MTGIRAQLDAEAYRVAAVQRAIGILNAFTPARPELALVDIAAITGLHKATTFRLLATLCAGGLVARNAESAIYRIGPRVIEWAELAKVATGFIGQARPYMRRIRDALNETVYIAVRSGNSRINLEQAEALREVRRVIGLGEPKPLYVGSTSRVLLAAMSDREIDDYLGATDLKLPYPHPPVSLKILWQQIETIRRNGYAESFNQRYAEGTSVSVAIRGPGDTVLGALTVSIPIARYTDEVRAGTIEEVLRAAHALSHELGAPAREAE